MWTPTFATALQTTLVRIAAWSSRSAPASDLIIISKMGLRRFHSPQAFFFAGATGRKLHSSHSLGENPLPWLGNIVQRGIRVQSRQVQGELAPERQQPERRWDDRKLPSRGTKCVRDRKRTRLNSRHKC